MKTVLGLVAVAFSFDGRYSPGWVLFFLLAGAVGVLKSLVWPAFAIYKLMEFLKM